jgi:hypothetical protein
MSQEIQSSGATNIGAYTHSLSANRPRVFWALIAIAFCLCTLRGVAEERIWGRILDVDGDYYIVQAEDGTCYRVEWFSGSSTWDVGDQVILTADSGFGFMVYGTNYTRVWIEETDQDQPGGDDSDTDPN